MNHGTAVILANAIIWAAVIAATALTVTGTEYVSQLLIVVGGGAATSVVIVGGGIRRMRSGS